MAYPPFEGRAVEKGHRGGSANAVSRLLGIYLNDHLAGAVVGIELAKRAEQNNRGNDFGRFLARLVEEIQEDRSTLERVMDRLGVRRSRVKPTVGIVLERLGRLKLNGRVASYSPLSRVVELEGLMLGVTGKLGLWRALDRLGDPRLAEFELGALAERANRQRTELEEHRLRAAEIALSRD
jgi:hypothetical protein